MGAKQEFPPISENISVENVGTTGAGVFKERDGDVIKLRKIKGGGNTVVTEGADDIEIKNDAVLWQIHRKTLDATDIANKYIQLPTTPTDLSDVMMTVRGAPDQRLNSDFDCNAFGRVGWNGLGLSGILAVGDEVKVFYH